MQVRWKLACLACAALTALGILSEALLSTFDGEERVYVAKNVLDGATNGGVETLKFRSSTLSLYIGTYKLYKNGTEGIGGIAKATLASQPTALSAIRASSIALTLIGARAQSQRRWAAGHTEEDRELQLHGLDWTESKDGRVLAFGLTGNLEEGPAAAATAIQDFFGFGSPDETSKAQGDGKPESCRLEGSLEVPKQEEKRDKKASQEGLAGLQSFVADIVSSDCRSFSMRLAMRIVDLEQIGRKVVNYSIWMNMLTMVQIRFFLLQMRYTEEGTSSSGKLSIIALSAQALMDAYDSFLHLSISSSPIHVFNTYNFAVVSLLKFSLFALLEVRYLLIVWRHRHFGIFEQGWDVVRQELSRVYSYFYGAVIGGLTFIFFAVDFLDFIAFVMQAFWIPQIVHDVKHGSKNSFSLSFIMVMSVTRCVQFLYLWGCPEGVFSGEVYPKLPGAPSPELCVAAVFLHATQVGIMLSQKRFGPRWFVPWLCLPHVYNYRRAAAEAPASMECVICMMEMDLEDTRGRAFTPCSHAFHETCLERWMDVKMECPTCRAPLPPMH
eukprot:TRINITY_DN11985_c0_g1_i2.p1 TRINITY_DN11985_c0_g1~~TRINITY_DN11985_c0_g1_i2.p1  ORF type:complete len:554 (+),score=93.03 TRINITY_DN11985_c0_g1_i2:110-1771(+)